MSTSMLVISTLLAVSPSAATDYTVLQRSPIGGAGGWDFLAIDPPNHRLYIARNDRVLVVDSDTAKLIATVPGMDGAHGVALAPN